MSDRYFTEMLCPQRQKAKEELNSDSDSESESNANDDSSHLTHVTVELPCVQRCSPDLAVSLERATTETKNAHAKIATGHSTSEELIPDQATVHTIEKRQDTASEPLPDPAVAMRSVELDFVINPDPRKRKSTALSAELLPNPKKRLITAELLPEPNRRLIIAEHLSDPPVLEKRKSTAAELLPSDHTNITEKKKGSPVPIYTSNMVIEAQYISEIRSLYIHLIATQTSDIQWPPPCTHQVFNLAMVKEEQVKRSNIIDSYIRMTITGKLDDILHVKIPIELENIFDGVRPNKRKVVLMEGAPGCGKSTLTNFISQQWGKHKLFTYFKAVILVRLRDPVVQKAKSIVDLFPSGDDITVAEKAEESMQASKFQDVLFILDGWDELPRSLREDSIFRKLIQDDQAEKHGLDKSAVIVTSRPVASGDLHMIVSTRVEILGFTHGQLQYYFQECLEGNSKAVKTLLELIEENPEIAGTCYLPLNASILVHLFKHCHGNSLPTSQYGIFSLLVCTCISRHLKERTNYKYLSLKSLDQLVDTEIIKEPFRFLCDLAYNGVMTDRIVFSSLPNNTDTLSILHGVESFVKRDDKVKSYNFIHLSIQELLAAFYMMKWLPPEEQVAMFNNLFDNPRFGAILQFYSAMTELKTPGITDILAKVAEQCSEHSRNDEVKILLVALLHCLNAAQDPRLCELIMRYLQHGLNLGHTTLNPTDCLCIGYFLTCACNTGTGTSKFKTKLFNCNIGDKGCKYLVKGLQKQLTESDHAVTRLYMDLKWNNIHEEGSIELSKLLHFDYIDALNLNGNEALYDQGIFHIAETLKTNTSLTELGLYTCGLTAKGIGYIAVGIEVNSSLKLLNIGGNGIYDEGIKTLAEVLKINHSLKSLNLSSCGMTDVGLHHIATSLLHNLSLQELKLYNFQNQVHLNKITVNSSAMKYLIETLKTHSKLVNLELPAYFESSKRIIQNIINDARKLKNAPFIKITG